MDRNRLGLGHYRDDVSSLSARRAWIEISSLDDILAGVKSLSARRAWIEIEARTLVSKTVKSLSARRAWIEIAVLNLIPLSETVALRKESVDRNIPPTPTSQTSSRRSPQGERG